MYTLYKDEKQLTEPVVAALFTTGFVCAGATASFVGALADKHGRRNACLTLCVAYAMSCLSVLSNDLTILFAGRALGGLSTTLLYSVFETWMIAEYHSRGLSECLRLEDMFGMSVTFSGVVAIVAGVVGEAVVGWSGTKVAPFVVTIGCLGGAFTSIWKFWVSGEKLVLWFVLLTGEKGENYGEPEDEKAGIDLRASLLDKRVLALTLATTIFEGSMYLFVFFWAPALKSARAMAGIKDLPPFGLIFSAFMCMMMGSMVFSSFNPRSGRDTGKLLLSILAMAANSLLVPVLSNQEAVIFWSFALFEMCVGLYFPTMSRLKSELVEDAVRGRFMR